MSKSIQFKNSSNEKIYPHPFYPIGSIYLSVNNINPSKWFGGKWEQIAKGRTLVGVDTTQTEFNSVKKVGGEKSHILTIEEMPKHRHDVRCNSKPGGDLAAATLTFGTAYMGFDQNITDYSGRNKSHNNLQPYFTCYIWCRIA